MEKTIPRIGRALLALNMIAILTSMAAMELFSWLLFLFVVYEAVRRLIQKRSLEVADLKVPLTVLKFLFVSLMIGIGLNVTDPKAMLAAYGDIRWIFLLPTFALAFRWWMSRDDHSQLKWWWAVVGVVSAYAGVQFFTGIELFRNHQILYPFGPFWRATGMFNMPLTFAACLGMCLCVGYAHLIWPPEPHFRRPYYFIVAALGILAMVGSLTRGAWLAFAVAILVMMAFHLSRKKLVLFFVSGILLLLAATQVPGIGDRLMGMLDFASDTYRERFELWRANYAMFLDHPFFGVGYGQNYKHLPEYFARLNITHGFISHAHNTYFQWLGGTGATGFLLFLTLSALIVVRTFKLIRASRWVWGPTLALGLLGAQAQLHFGGLTEASFFDGEVNHVVMMVWGLVLALPLGDSKAIVPG